MNYTLFAVRCSLFAVVFHCSLFAVITEQINDDDDDDYCISCVLTSFPLNETCYGRPMVQRRVNVILLRPVRRIYRWLRYAIVLDTMLYENLKVRKIPCIASYLV